MYTLDVENAKKIRRKLDIVAGIDAVPHLTGTIAVTGEMGIDNDIEKQGIINKLCDLEGDGFPLDGTRFFDGETTRVGYLGTDLADENGDLATPLEVEMALSVPGAPSSERDVITLFFDEVAEVVIHAEEEDAGTTDFEVSKRVLIPAYTISHPGAYGMTLTIDKWTPHRRPKITRIHLGDAYRFDNDNIISVTGAFRTDLSVKPSIPFSDLEITAYETSEPSFSAFIEGSPIWYSSGYETDMSDMRRFYQSEPLGYNNNVLSVTGQDSATKLDSDLTPTLFSQYHFGGRKNLFEFAEYILTDRGISYTSSAAPTGTDTGDQAQFLIKEQSARELLASMVNIMPIDFVDAGIPTLSQRHLTGQTWKIDNFGNLKIYVEKKYTAVKYDTEKEVQQLPYGVVETFEYTWADYITGLSEIVREYSDYYLNLDVDIPAGFDADVTFSTMNKLQISIHSFDYLAYPSGVTFTVSGNKIEDAVVRRKNPYSETALDLSGGWTARYYNNAGNNVDDDFLSPLTRSAKTVELIYRYDPRMQPRDKIILPDSTEFLIEAIAFEQRGGGSVATITGRLL